MSKKDESIAMRAERFVAEAQAKYSTALSEARAAADTTATPAWQHNYQLALSDHDKLVRGLTTTVEKTAKLIADFHTNEDSEKEIRDSVKSLAEERIRHQAWLSRTVSPYRSKAEKCESVLSALRGAARRTEEDGPLIMHGLIDAVNAIVRTWPSVEWNDKGGVLMVRPGEQVIAAAAG